jgi:Na+/melibiose symporter-like transporter
MTEIRTALRHRDLRLLLSAGLISLTGDWVLRVGLTYYIYVLTRSTLASALMLLASFVPQIVLGWVRRPASFPCSPRRPAVTSSVVSSSWSRSARAGCRG